MEPTGVEKWLLSNGSVVPFAFYMIQKGNITTIMESPRAPEPVWFCREQNKAKPLALPNRSGFAESKTKQNPSRSRTGLVLQRAKQSKTPRAPEPVWEGEGTLLL